MYYEYEFDGSQRCNMIIIITMSLLIQLAGTIKWKLYDDIVRLDTCTILQVLTYSYKAVVKYYFKFGELKNKRRKAECWPGKTCRPWNVLFTTRGIDEYV